MLSGMLASIAAGRRYRPVAAPPASPTTMEEWWLAESVKAGVTFATDFRNAADVIDNRHIDGQQANITQDTESIPGSAGKSMKLNIPATSGANPGAWRRRADTSWTNTTQGFLHDEHFYYYAVKLGPGWLVPSNGGGGKKICIISGVKIGDENSSASAQGFEIVLHAGSNGSVSRVVEMYHSINQHFQDDVGFGLSIQPALDLGATLPNDRRRCIWSSGDDLSAGTVEFEEGIWLRFKHRIKCLTYDGTAGNEMDTWVAWPSDTEWTQLYSPRNFYLGANDGFYTGGFSGPWFTGYDTGRTNADRDTWFKVSHLIISRNDIALSPAIEPLPSWYTAMADLEWANPVTNTVGDVYLPTSNDMPAAGLYSWAAGTTHRLTSSLDFGPAGGHGDGDANSKFRVALKTTSPAWVRQTAPSTPTGGTELSGVYGDGQPRGTHTWRHLVDAGAYGTWLAPITAVYSAGTNSGRYFSFDDQALTWTARGYQPGTSASVSLGDNGADMGSEYDPWTGHIYCAAAVGPFWKINPATGVASAMSAEYTGNYNTGTALSMQRRCFLIWKSGTIYLLNLDAGTIHTPPMSGSAFPTVPNLGFDWCQSAGKFIAWGQTSGTTTIYTLTPPTGKANWFTGTWIRSSVTAAGTNSVTPTGSDANGNHIPTVRVLPNFGGLKRDLLIVYGGTAASNKPFLLKLPKGGV